MNIEQIIALTQAGFTKNDIIAMSGQNQQMPAQNQQMPAQNQQMPFQNQQIPAHNQQMPVQNQNIPVQTPQMQNAYYAYGGYPQNINQQSQQISDQNDVLSALRNLTRSVQSNNVNMMQNQMPKQATTEDAIASIINPPNYEGLNDGGVK